MHTVRTVFRTVLPGSRLDAVINLANLGWAARSDVFSKGGRYPTSSIIMVNDLVLPPGSVKTTSSPKRIDPLPRFCERLEHEK